MQSWRNTASWGHFYRKQASDHFRVNSEKVLTISEYGNFDLHYYHKPLLLIEAKFNETDISKSLLKFQRYFNVPAIQLVNREDTYRVIRNKDNSVLIVTAHRWLSALPFRT